MRRRKRKLEHRFKKTGSGKDFQSFKGVREVRKSKSPFFCKTFNKKSSDTKTAFKTVHFRRTECFESGFGVTAVLEEIKSLI